MGKYLFILAILLPSPAFAHKLNLFAQARGVTIEGRAYFTGDIAARGIEVVARDPSGVELARAKTDDNGKFSFAASAKVDYQLSAETPDGHAATLVVSANELSDTLPAASAAAAISLTNSSEEVTSHNATISPTAAAHAELPGIETLGKQIAALREQIDQSEQRLRFRDLLGGIGYILGLAGIWVLVKARHSKSKPVTPSEATD